MDALNSVLAQYQKNTASGNARISEEERMKKYFTTVLPKGVKSQEKRIRILPTQDGSSPFVEKYFHEINVNGTSLKLYDPAQDGLRSPLNEVYKGLKSTGDPADDELAKNYRSRKFYIVKVIDRDNEQDGPKFWRFKHNAKKEGIFDKIFPIYRNKGDIANPDTGRDLILSLTSTKSNNGKDYTTINSIFPEDSTPLHTDKETASSWINDETTWKDVYSIKGEDYLEIIAKGETPKWDNDLKKFVSSSELDESEEDFGKPNTNNNMSSLLGGTMPSTNINTVATTNGNTTITTINSGTVATTNTVNNSADFDDNYESDDLPF